MHVGHYAHNLGAPGGISQYVQRLGAAQEATGIDITYFSSVSPPDDSSLPGCTTVTPGDDLFAAARDAGLDLLHLHDPIPLPDDSLPVLRTMHGNHGSCPGGGRFLAHSQVPCTRDVSFTGCFWHRLTEHCGSRRPAQFLADYQRTQHEMASVESIPTLTVSRFLREQMEKSGADVSNVNVLLSPAPEVQTPYAAPPQDEPARFLFLGRLVPAKGLDWLLNALAQVGPGIHLDVAGDGNLDTYVALARDLGVSDRVTFHGWVDSANVSDLINRTRAVIVPSMWAEPAGLVTLEAAANGRAVIASRTGGIPEYADSSFASLVSPGAVDELAAQIRQMASDASLAASMGKAGRAYVQRHHGMPTFLEAIADHYADAIETASHSSRPATTSVASPR